MAKTLIAIAIVAALSVAAAAFQGAYPQPSPGRGGAAPVWNRIVKMSDGRTFISDGALTIDLALAKPATVPDRVLGNAKIIEGYLNAQLPDAIGLGQLGRGEAVNYYAAPNGIRLNAGYIDYLRRALPTPRVVLRLKTDLDPVIIVLDGKAVGLVMPMRSLS